MKWSFPKGHIKARESWSQCAFRECYEETGIAVNDLCPKHPRKLLAGYYYIYTNVDEVIPNIQDNSEVVNVDWVPLENIKYLKNNIDVTNFVNDSHNILNNHMP